MRRIAPLAVVAIPLVSTLAGCDDTAAPPPTGDTVAVGGLPDDLPTVATAATESTAPPTPLEHTAPSEPTPTDVATSVPDAQTVFAELLAEELGGDVADAPRSRRLVDDTRRLRFEVPSTWTEARTTPATDGDGQEVPSVSAAPQLAAFLDGFGGPGLTAVVVDDDPRDALAAYDFAQDCEADGVAPYRGDELDGAYDVWRDCGGTGNAIVTVAVRPDGSNGTVLLLAQLTEPPDAAALDHALGTLTLRA